MFIIVPAHLAAVNKPLALDKEGGESMKESVLGASRVGIALAVVLGLFVFPASFDVAEGAESHCVVFVVDQREDGEFVLSEPDCFADELSASVWASYGLPLVGSGAGSADSGGVVAATTFILGKHYDGFNGTGSSITVVGSSCTGGYWNTSSSWDNRISSSYNGCARLRHWDYPYKSGSSESTYGSGTTDNLSYMNNRTESVSYHSG